MTIAFEIRPTQAHEEWAVAQLFEGLHYYNTSLDHYFSLSPDWREALHTFLIDQALNQRGITMLAWHGSTPIGLLMLAGQQGSALFKHRNWAELLALYVVQEVRGLGVAQSLLNLAQAWASAQGYQRIQLYVTASNHRAKRFYQAQGWQCVQEIWRLSLDQGQQLADHAEHMNVCLSSQRE
ncbi:MAG TPA: N-acetyltransferase [Herpetosiphon sp.]|uniref:GCN5-related N-acetyltransferase n=1 Tax=Herpetosiphon aurantiacus (strain ATCC 23779 / DSM 785 / 114-95) TaxID=316274 RepID=A9B3L4_HERA2|nr:GNAT family N-acetyltransferase [Herpetosiphon sp.]ABX05586.1 GCN5-related N-acetyltransferase [Herpetosiphon aurantiacus DSM 785]HBW52134.1 N-acetyltransferase [Herpetosiphon sp.]